MNLLSKIDWSKNWGEICNEINAVAHKVLTAIEFDDIVKKQNADALECSDMDGVLFNCCYFDWRQFGNTKMIVKAFLKYFTPKQLELIERGM